MRKHRSVKQQAGLRSVGGRSSREAARLLESNRPIQVWLQAAGLLGTASGVKQPGCWDIDSKPQIRVQQPGCLWAVLD
jgi:hypothetical protein